MSVLDRLIGNVVVLYDKSVEFSFLVIEPYCWLVQNLSSIKGHVGLHIQAVEVQEQRVVRNTTQLVRNSSFLSGGTDYLLKSCNEG